MDEQTYESVPEEDAKTGEAPEEKQNKPNYKSIRLWLFVGILIGVLISQVVVLCMLRVKNKPTLSLMNGQVSRKEDTFLTKEIEEKIRLIENSIDFNYISDVDNKAFADGIYEGLIDATGDKYADYYTPDEIEKLEESMTGVFYGIGCYVGIDKDTGYPKLTGIIPDTPAEEAGLQAEDILVKIDGVDQRGRELTDVANSIRGDIGTTVMLTILRHNEHDFREIEVKRGEVASPTVYYELKEDGIAYIRVAQFESVTSKQFEEKLEQARRDGMKGLLLDLRSNPGGTLESVLKMCRMILPKGMIVYMEDKYGKRDEFKCAGDSQLEVPLVVLINENTASAAEIMAGAIKDHGIGTLVGKNTFGKGIVQKVFFLSDGSAIKLTISHYYTPNGNDIHEVGIKPDIDIDLDVDKYLDEKIDTQYEKAVSVLKDKMKG